MSTYKLEIESNGLKYNGATTGATPVVLTNSTPVTVQFDKFVLTMSLYGLIFSRKVYEPGHIQAEVLITTDRDDKNASKNPDLDTLTSLFLNRPVKLYVDSSEVASAYYIHEISPQFEKSSKTEKKPNPYTGIEEEVTTSLWSIYVRLDIFSMDKLFTLNKFSHAFLGKKLFTEIVKDSIDDFPLSYTATVNDIPKVVTNKIKLNSTNSLTNLGYGTDTKTEYVQPYLIQYNETFYAFLRRVANRCGEVFYYEGGELCFGLPAKPKDKAGNTSIPRVNDAKRVVFQRITSSPVSVEDYMRDSEKEWDSTNKTYDPGEKKIMADPVDVDGGFPKEAFRKPAEEGGFPYFYNSEIASEDHYVVLYMDRFARDKDLDIFWPDNGTKLMEGLQEILNCKSLMDLLTKSFSKVITGGIVAGAKKNDKTKEGNDGIVESNRFNPLNKKGTAYTVVNTPVDNDTSHWLTLNYYSDIRSREELQMRKMVCVDMGEGVRDVKLGSYIKLPNDDKYYVVVQIDMHSADVWQRNYDGFVGESTGLKDVKRPQSQVFYAIPLVNNTTFYPPLLPDSPFRKSGPLPAFVVDSKDPYSHGRVRIRYPWQHFPATEKKDADDAESTYNTAKETYEKDKSSTNKTAMDNAEETWKEKDYKLQVANAASPWIRMATPMATSGGGMYFKPEKGDEVMVDFENGNIERPYVVGTLYSKNVPQPTQGNRVIVSKNGHTIKMTDPSNFADFISGMYPGMKFVTSFGVDLPTNLEDLGKEVLGGIEMTDKWGFYKIKMSSHDRNISISSPFGDVKINAFTGIKIEAPNGNVKIEGKNVDIVAGNRVRIVSGDNIKRGGFLGNMKKEGPQILAAYTEAATKGVLQGFGLDKFFDFSLLRSVLEVFIRPVDGTLDLKSNRFLLLEAGGSTADIPVSNFKSGKHVVRHANEGEAVLYMFRDMGNRIDKYVADYVSLFNSLLTDLASMQATDIEAPNPTVPVISDPGTKKDLLFKMFKEDCSDFMKTGRIYDFIDKKVQYNAQPTTGDKNSVRPKLVKLLKSVMALKSHLLKYHHLFDSLNPTLSGKKRYQYLGPFLANLFSSSVGKYVGDLNSFIYADDYDPGHQNGVARHVKEMEKFLNNDAQADMNVFGAPLGVPAFSGDMKMMKRGCARILIEKFRTSDDFATIVFPAADYGGANAPGAPVTDDNDWATYVGAVKIENHAKDDYGASFGKAVLKGLADTAVGGEDSSMFKFGSDISLWKMEGDIWGDAANGEVLFSNDKTKTYSFNKDQGAIDCHHSRVDDVMNQQNPPQIAVKGYGSRLKDLLDYQ